MYIREREESPDRIIGVPGCVGGVGLESPTAFKFRQLPQKHRNFDLLCVQAKLTVEEYGGDGARKHYAAFGLFGAGLVSKY